MPRSAGDDDFFAAMTVVSIVQRRLTNYRVPLFDLMHEGLARRGIELRLLYGQGTPDEALKHDSGVLPWGTPITTRYLLGERICWQPYLSKADGSSLIVMAQENKQVVNFVSMLRYQRLGPRIAFWGHGRNMQSASPDSASERVKRWAVRHVDWWFAYTEISAGFVAEAGFPGERTTVLNNSIDTGELRQRIERASQLETIEQRRAEFGLGHGPVGLFIGSLYGDKRLPFLVESAKRIRARVPEFELVIAGAGDDLPIVETAVREHHFIKYVGVVANDQKARLLSCTSLVLNPGLVGLSILDSFVAGLPLFTTDCKIHSPEIAYLREGINGVMTADRVEAYVDAVIATLQSSDRLQALQAGAKSSADDFSIEMMAKRYCDGIVQCLAAPKLRAA